MSSGNHHEDHAGPACRTVQRPVAGRLLTAFGWPLLAAAGLAVLLVYDPLDGRGLIPCLFHALTGLYCIGCGSTRALSSLLDGDLHHALSFNAWFVAWLFWPVWWAAAYWLKAVAGRWIIPPPKVRRGLLIALLASAMVFLILRNLPWPPMNWLAP